MQQSGLADPYNVAATATDKEPTPMSPTGQLVTERFEYDGGRQVTAYVPPAPRGHLLRAGRNPRPSLFGTERRFVVVRQLKRHLIGYAWAIGLRELLRIPQIPVEIRRGSVILAGLVTGPFVISAFVWWVLTGKRLPGPLGARLHDPAVVRVNLFRKLPASLLEDSTAPGLGSE